MKAVLFTVFGWLTKKFNLFNPQKKFKCLYSVKDLANEFKMIPSTNKSQRSKYEQIYLSNIH